MKKILRLRKILSMILAVMLTLSISAPSALALNEKVKDFPITMFLGNTRILTPDDSIVMEDEDGTWTAMPSTLLSGNTLYLPFLIFFECGLTLLIDGDENDWQVIIQSSEYTSGPFYPRTRQKLSADYEYILNAYNITANGEQIAQEGKEIWYNHEKCPSSIFITDGTSSMFYFPAQYIFQKFGIDTIWDKNSQTFSISSSISDSIGLSNFKKRATYVEGQFIDVPQATWYANHVKTAYEYGLMIGTDSKFNPNENISIAQAIVIAARMHNTYWGNNYEFQTSSPWYQDYLDYAKEHEIVPNIFSDFDVPITRGEFALLMANSLPLPSINEIKNGAIPDIKRESSYYDAVYSLYRAGITSGTDAFGTFNPDLKISRAQVAVILSNMANSQARKTFTLETSILPYSIFIPPKVTLPLNGGQRISAITAPFDVTKDTKITWKSSNSTIVSVDSSGLIKGHNTGTATITATTVNGLSAECLVKVIPQADLDLACAQKALSMLKDRLKFQDTLEIISIWASSSTDSGKNLIKISIYHTALSQLELRVRDEYVVTFDIDEGSVQSDTFNGRVASHSTDRVLDIKKIVDQ